MTVPTTPATCAADMHGDAIFWNPGNVAYQCHRCGQAFDERPAPSSDYRALLADLVRALGEAVADPDSTLAIAHMLRRLDLGIAGRPESRPTLGRLYDAYARAVAAVGEKGEG